MGSRGRFVEVFSGANAPLSRAVCEVLGESLKGSKVRTYKGLKVELQRLAQVLGEGPQVVAAPTAEGPPRAEILANRMATLESGRQPSYGKRQQLIPDGLNSVREHLERAMRLDHPFNTTESLKADHHEALSAQILSEKDMNELRLRVLADWRQLSKSTPLWSCSRATKQWRETTPGVLGGSLAQPLRRSWEEDTR